MMDRNTPYDAAALNAGNALVERRRLRRHLAHKHSLKHKMLEALRAEREAKRESEEGTLRPLI